MPSRPSTHVEPLEARIAPATISGAHPLPDIVAGGNQTGTTVDLSYLFAPDGSGDSAKHTFVTIHTNFDADPGTPGIQGDITIELLDDVAPLTVQNFLAYATSKNANGDYTGTFLHRLALDAGLKVLQGGGFQPDGTKVEHIDTLAEVHNEYNPDYKNERGTIALAKTGLGPNTGTSEWFINLDDANADTLNSSNNGGFTVFGKIIDKPGVIDGMDVVDAISRLPTSVVVSGFPAPVQNYNPSTATTVPAASNLITITSVDVQHSGGGTASDGITYELVSVNQKGSTAASNVVSGAISNHNLLDLKYLAGQAGIATVTVKATRGTEVVTEDFDVTVLPNLVTYLQSDTLPTLLIPGDSGKVTLQIDNTGAGVAHGNVDVHFYLVKTQFSGNQYQVINPLVRTELNTVQVPIDIAGGKSSVITANAQIPNELLASPGSVYQLFAEVTPHKDAGTQQSSFTELYSDDNATIQGRLHQTVNQFGTFTTAEAGSSSIRSHTTLTYTEPDGDVVTFQIKGPGAGTVTKAADGSLDLQLTGTTAKTIVKAVVTSPNGEVSIRNIDALSPVGTLDFTQVDVSGQMAFPNGVKSLKLGDVTGPSNLSIGLFAGAEAQAAKLSFGRITDLTVNSTMPIASFSALEWLDTTGAHDSLTAQSLRSLTISGKTAKDPAAVIRGDMEADVFVAGSAGTKTFQVAGLLNEATVQLSGNVTSVSLGGIAHSDFLVGTNARPDSLDDFTGSFTVGKFSIRGLADVGSAFSDSTVAAARFNNVTVLGVDGTSSETEFGVVADAIKSYNRVGGLKLSKLSEPSAPLDPAANYDVRIL